MSRTSEALAKQRQVIRAVRRAPMFGDAVSFSRDGIIFRGRVTAISLGRQSIDVETSDGESVFNVTEWEFESDT